MGCSVKYVCRLVKLYEQIQDAGPVFADDVRFGDTLSGAALGNHIRRSQRSTLCKVFLREEAVDLFATPRPRLGSKRLYHELIQIHGA
jgi:hypothetical protein